MKPCVYGILGWKGHGKDTFARALSSANPEYQVTHFAAKLKEQAGRIFGLTEEQMTVLEAKEAPLPAPIKMDAYVEAMRSVTGLANIQPQGKVADTPRKVLQYYGTEYVRYAQDDYWTQVVLEFCGEHPHVLIPDTRFVNEGAALRSIGGRLIRVVRIDLKVPTDLHASEAEGLKVEPDLLLGNVSGRFSLQNRVVQLLAAGKFEECQSYDYRLARQVLDARAAGATLEDCAELLHTDDVEVASFVLRYYQ